MTGLVEVLKRTGAGKTITIRILATLLRPEGGTVRVLGHDVVREAAAVRQLVSLTGQLASVDAALTAEELAARTRRVRPNARLLEQEFPECKIGYCNRLGRVTWTIRSAPR